MQTPFTGNALAGDVLRGNMKNAGTLSWSEVDSREAALISRCTAGDQTACAELVAEHQRMVYQLSLNLLGDHNEALDLSQEVFLRVFRTIHTFRGQSALRTWIFRIVINQARNRQRWWNRRHRRQQVSLDEHIEQNGEMAEQGDAGAPDRALDRKELAARIATALDALPFDQRTAIVLREVDGLSYEEIAFSLGVTLGAVKARLTRARQALRATLKETRAR
jgi:RNA polymerase sigma-70 factor (ECF subfamily)